MCKFHHSINIFLFWDKQLHYCFLLNLTLTHKTLNSLLSQYPEQFVMSEELELPKAVIKRIVKNKLNSTSVNNEDRKDFQVNKDALLAFGESTKVFIQYVACLANEHCKKNKRSTLSVEDVFKVLEEIEFGDYIEPLKAALAERKDVKAQKKGVKRSNEDELDDSVAKKIKEKEDEDGGQQDEGTNQSLENQDSSQAQNIEICEGNKESETEQQEKIMMEQ
eukprot:TRINITY_DN131_c0_g1_i4.p1 TRINITY_DN131_c0_g1~~TRINITY_DN131_c0_g1_i4.p1  ORF type:complete len:221 (-),score=36.05 TRINITY_DN131_c0_g1_i4:107-769(-)